MKILSTDIEIFCIVGTIHGYFKVTSSGKVMRAWLGNYTTHGMELFKQEDIDSIRSAGIESIKNAVKEI